MSGTPPSASAYAAASSSSPAAVPPRRQPYQYQQHQAQQRSIGGAPSASSSSPPSSAPAFPPLSASSSSTSSSVYANTPPPPAQGQTNSARSSQTGSNTFGGGGGLGDARAIAFEHWSAFKSFLVELLRKEPPGSRQNAREKLTRLTKQQFQELSTDVYDELVRRLGPTNEGSEIAGGGGEVPFLPLRPDFHPKRNQARQKLATLPKNRFKDLASDVYFELNRRYPEFSEPEQPDEPQRLFNRPPPSARGAPETPSVYGATSSNLSFHRQNDSGNGIPVNPNNVRSSTASSSNTGGFDFDSRQSFDRPPLSVANSSSPTSMTFPRGQGGARPPVAAAQNGSSSYQLQQRSSVASRSLSSSSIPSSQDNNYRPSPPRPTASSSSISSQQRPPLQPSTAVSTTLIAPTKSTMVASEEIQVPYARDSLPASSARLSRAEDEDGYGIRSEDVLRKEYELKIAQLSARVAAVEETAASAREGETRERESKEAAERDVALVKEQLVTFSEKLRGLEVELEGTRTAHAREKERARASEAQVRELELNPPSSSQVPSASQEDLQSVKTQIKDLMRELNGLSVLNDELHAERESEREKVRLAEDRAKEMEAKWRAAKLELRNLKATSQMFVSARRTEDHLPATRNGALADVHVQTFQTSIDGVITAARSTTPSSVLAAMKHVIVAVQSISSDVELFEARPPAERLDIDMNTLRSLKDRSTTNLTTFAHAAKEFATSYGLSPISLLDAAASELAANIVGLTKLLGIRRTTGSSNSVEGNDSAKSTTNGGSNLTASISSASLSAASTDRGGMSFSTAPSSVSRNPSSASSFQSDAYDARSSQYTARPSHRDSQDQHQQQQQDQQQRARLRSDASRRGTSTSSIGSAFDLERKPSTTATDTSSRGHGGGGRWDGGAGGNMFNDKLDRDGAAEELRLGEGDENESEEDGDGDRAWNELKPYLDTQSDSLISSISTLLSSVRSNEPSPVVRDNLSSVIVLGSSIVGVSKDSLPAHSLGEGRRLLRELAANCDLLSEISEGSELGVPERNRITGPTFELARNLKSLMSI